jgi:hypothetical protein
MCYVCIACNKVNNSHCIRKTHINAKRIMHLSLCLMIGLAEMFALFWDVMQRRLVVKGVSGQPTGPLFKGQVVQDS